MDLNPTKEGYIPFAVGNIEKPCVTFYKVFGDLGCGKRSQLSTEQQTILEQAEGEGAWETPAVQDIAAHMATKHIIRASVSPFELVPAFTHLSEETTAYRTMYGPIWLAPKGGLEKWTSMPGLPNISAPTLVYNGEYDTSHDIATVPFFELIPRVRWVTFANSGHMSHLEEGGLRERVLNTVGDFLVQKI